MAVDNSKNCPPGYQQTEVGVIPEDWAIETLGNRARFKTGPFGSALHKSDYIWDGIPIINPMHILDGNLYASKNMTITRERAIQLSDFRLRENDIVIGRRGDMGRCAVVKSDQSGWLCGTGSMIVRCGSGATPDFVQRILASPRAISQIENTSVGSTMVNLNQATLSELLVQFPPKAEQETIAEALSDADGLIDGLSTLIAKKRAIKQGAMQELLTGKTRLPGFQVKPGYQQTEVGVIPEDWDSLPFATLYLEPSRNGIYKSSEFQGRGTRIVNMGEMFGFEFIGEQEMSRIELTNRELATSRLQNGDLLFGRRSVVPAGAGKCSLVVFHNEPITFESSIIRVRLDLIKSLALFYYYYFASPSGRSVIKGIVAGTNVKGIRASELRELKVVIPPKAEQEAIASVLSDMDTEIEQLETKLEKAKQIKQGMMHELLTGRIRLVA